MFLSEGLTTLSVSVRTDNAMMGESPNCTSCCDFTSPEN